MAVDLNPVPNRLTRPDTLDADADSFFGKLPAWLTDLYSIQANFNSIAAGGAYGLPYVWGSGINIGGNPAQNSTPLFAITNNTSGGWSALSQLQQFDASASAVKGQGRIIAAGDPSRYINFNVTGRTDSGTYQVINVVVTGASATNPFNSNDPVLVFFQRAGDPGVIQQVVVRDQKGNNVGPQALTGGAWNRRVLNTLVGNQVTGFQLGAAAANTFTLTRGKYWLDVSSNSRNGGNQQLRLFNVTANGTYDIGGSDFANSGNGDFPSSARITLRTYLEITSDTVYAIEHYVSASCNGGIASAAGIGEVYTEMRIVKVG